MRIGQIAIDVAPLRESRDFRRLFTGRFVAQAGNAVATTAANWQVYGLTHNSLAVGLLTLADGAGMLAGLLTGGMLADRYDRRILLMVVRLPQALLAGLLMVNSLLGHPALWPLYVITFGIGALSGLSAPASTAATPALVSADKLPAAAALNATAGQLGSLGGPALAGLLIAGPGLAACYAINAACFAVFGLAMIGMRPLPPTTKAQRPGLRSLAEGFRYVRHNGVVGGMLLVDTNAMIFGMPSALFPAMASTHFHGGSATFGLLVAAPGLGALVGAATSGWTGQAQAPGDGGHRCRDRVGAGDRRVRHHSQLAARAVLPRASRHGGHDLRDTAQRAAPALHPGPAAGPGVQPVPRPGDRRPGNRERRSRRRGPACLAGVLSGDWRPCVRGRRVGARRDDPGAARGNVRRARREPAAPASHESAESAA